MQSFVNGDNFAIADESENLNKTKMTEQNDELTKEVVSSDSKTEQKWLIERKTKE